MARILIRVYGQDSSALFLALVDTGAAYLVLPGLDCRNLGLSKTGKTVRLATARGVIESSIYRAGRVGIEGTRLCVNDVEVVAKVVPGVRALLGMIFLRQFDFCFMGPSRMFTVEGSEA